MRRLISGGARSSAAFTATRSRVLTGCTPWRPVFCRTSYACSSVRDTEFQGRVYAVSDIHTDYPENLTWAKRQLHIDHRQDVLIVAGDVSHDLGLFQQTLSLLRDAYSQVFFTFGNHELWTRHRQQGTSLISQLGASTSSVDKLHLVKAVCADLGVFTSPAKVGQHLWVVPLASWHHQSFDKEPDVPGAHVASGLTISDYRACTWPSEVLGDQGPGSRRLADWFDALNDELPLASQMSDCDVITFSHFLPLQALLPEKRFLYFQGLAKAAGSDALAARIRDLQPHLHIFGHTHFSWDAVIDGVRYVQAPLGTPRERMKRLPSIAFLPPPPLTWDQSAAERAPWLPVPVYQSAALPPMPGMQKLRHGHMCAPMHASWSDYYARNARDPENVELAPWVQQRLERRRKPGRVQ